ncbi:MAG TPA: hypothetical protein V6C88_09490 [Chroococcidiopsis sp.]
MDNSVLPLLSEISTKLKRLGWERGHPRLIEWAKQALMRSGWLEGNVYAYLAKFSPDNYWWALRAQLSIAALQALNRKLDQILDEQANQAEQLDLLRVEQ